jgi:phthiodiolone/phenolphthiodiolone dimycocerosates ketoreductase
MRDASASTQSSPEVTAMRVQPAAFFRTTLPLALPQLSDMDSGRYHSIWLPDHLVSFWPDSIWTPEFTDLATVSPSPHRHLDAMAMAAAAAVRTERVPIATSVVDTVRRHPALLAQTALTIDHLSKGRFILGLGSGETENTVPYGFDFSKPVSRFEESIEVIKLLWQRQGLIDFEGKFYRLQHARMDTELFAGRCPPIWVGASGPRMLEITGRHADGWWPAGAWTPDDYAEKLKRIHDAAERAGRDPFAIVPAILTMCLLGDEAELAEMFEAPLVKSILLMVTSEGLRRFGHEHPMGPHWRGFQDINPATLTRERIIEFCAKVDKQALIDLLPCGTPEQVARKLKGFCDAGMRVFKVLDYGAMAGLKFGAKSAQKVRETEDELLRLVGESA